MGDNTQSQEERKGQIILVTFSLNNTSILYTEKILESYRFDSPYY